MPTLQKNKLHALKYRYKLIHMFSTFTRGKESSEVIGIIMRINLGKDFNVHLHGYVFTPGQRILRVNTFPLVYTNLRKYLIHSTCNVKIGRVVRSLQSFKKIWVLV